MTNISSRDLGCNRTKDSSPHRSGQGFQLRAQQLLGVRYYHTSCMAEVASMDSRENISSDVGIFSVKLTMNRQTLTADVLH